MKILKYINKLSITLCFLMFTSVTLIAQPGNPLVVDEIEAIVGGSVILKSEIEEQAQQAFMQGMPNNMEVRCQILEQMILQKLLLYQAAKDSLTVSEDQVEGELQRRVDYFIQQFKSQEEMEEFLGKSIVEIKKEFREQVKDQLLIQQMQQKITGDVKVTPAEVKEFYDAIPKDSLPYISTEVEYAQIVILPKINDEEKKSVRKRLADLRQDILNGARFGLKAKLYSQDKGSKDKEGELGFMKREDLVTEFSAAAFRLKGNEISEIVETQFGFHIIQLIEKRGEMANFRHILFKPEPSDRDLLNAEKRLDSISKAIKSVDTLSFERAASYFSDDEDTRFNGGKAINPLSGTTQFQIDQLDQPTFEAIRTLKEGDISQPQVFETRTGKKAFRIVKLITRTKPHVADLKNDYQKMRDAAQQKKQNDMMLKWIMKKKNEVYLKISDRYKDCKFEAKFNN